MVVLVGKDDRPFPIPLVKKGDVWSFDTAKGRMIGGFAVIASPEIYGNSGVMTLIVNHDVVVYEKDLGKKTAKVSETIKKFDPDKTWKKVPETSAKKD